MNNERKILYLSVVINFVIGIILGIVLFFGQLRSGENIGQNVYEYNTTVSITDLFRMVWTCVLWLLSVIISYGILRTKHIHPVIVLRGCINAFAVLYVLYLFGLKAAAAAFLPQCFTVLPMLLMFSAETVYIQKKRENPGCGIVFKKSDIAVIIAMSVLSSGVEILIFKAFCTYLF